MKDSIYIVGAGGHTRSLLALISHQHTLYINGIYDDSYMPDSDETIFDVPVSGMLRDLPHSGIIIISFGNLIKRREYFDLFYNRLYNPNIIHPAAITEKHSDIGIANHIFANVFINAYARIGNNNILNTGCIIEHETEIGSHCHISVGSVLGGRVSIGDNVFIGAGATVIDKVSICSNVIVGANSTVIDDITVPGTYVGSPARRIK